MPRLLVSVLVPYYILLSFDFVLNACPGFVILLVFLVPHIKLVYLAFFHSIQVMLGVTYAILKKEKVSFFLSFFFYNKKLTFLCFTIHSKLLPQTR